MPRAPPEITVVTAKLESVTASSIRPTPSKVLDPAIMTFISPLLKAKKIRLVPLNRGEEWFGKFLIEGAEDGVFPRLPIPAAVAWGKGNRWGGLFVVHSL